MKKILCILNTFVIFCCGACEEEKVAKISLQNVVVTTPKVGPSAKKVETYVVDYANFPKNAAGKEIWKKNEKTGKADVTVVTDSELKLKVLKVKSDKASFYFQKEINIDLKKFEIASWKWKVSKNPKGGDVRAGSTDDQAIQVIFAFEGDYLLSYIWDPTAPVGYSKDASILFIVTQKVLVLESGEKNINQWMEIRRNLKEDFKKLYKMDAPKLAGVAVQANSQHTGTVCESFLGPITFETK